MNQSKLKAEYVPKARRTSREIALSRTRIGLRTSARLASVATAAGDEMAWRMACDIRRCCDARNIWIGRGLQNERGTFEGMSTLWRCGHLLCAHCHPVDARRLRKRAYEVLEPLASHLMVGQQMRFVTLTMPTAREVGLLPSHDVFRTAWTLFRKRKFWIEHVGDSGGGVLRIEFTVTDLGFHFHAHLVLACKHLDFDELRAEWSECVLNSWAEHGIEQRIVTKSGACFVKIEFPYTMVNGRRDRANLHGCVQEAVKYVCKPTDWLKLSDADLLAVAGASLERNRLPRWFEVLGRARDTSNAEINKARHDTRSIFNTGLLSDGEAGGKPKKLSDGREWSIKAFDGDQGALLRAASALGRREAMRVLPRWLWLIVSDEKIAVERARRREGLSWRYSQAEFETLAGDSWRGVK